MEGILILVVLVAISYIFKFIKKTYKFDSLDEMLDHEVETLEEEESSADSDDLFDWSGFGDDDEEETVKVEEPKPEPKKPVFVEGRGFIFQESKFVSDDHLKLEIIDEHEDEQGGVDPWFIHESLRNDLRRGIVLKEVLENRYNRRF